MKHLLILSFIAVFLLFGHQLGYTATSPWWTHLTYNFQHANLWHLLLNSVSFYYLFRALERAIPFRTVRQKFATCALLPLAIATAASFFTPYPQYLLNLLHHLPTLPLLGGAGGGHPVVGASGMIYAMIGMYFYILFKAGKFKNPHKASSWHAKSPLWGVGGLAIFLIIGFFKPNTAAMLHLLSFITGFAAMFVTRNP